MKDKKTRVLAPRLRFPEFRDAGEWEIKRLSDIGEVLQGYGFPESLQGKKTGKYPFYKVSDISNSIQFGRHFIGKSANYIDNEELVLIKAKIIPVGTTIFAKIGEAIKLNRRVITTCESVIDNNTAGVKAFNNKANDVFIFYTLSKIDLIEYAGGVVPAVSKTAIENIPVFTTSEAEQLKIASCLSSLDDLITAQSQKLETLKAHKKGLMQQLFPAEGGNVPKLRFREFWNMEEWEYKNGDNVFEQVSNKNHNSDLPILAITQEYGAIPRNKIDYTVIVTDKSIERYKIVEFGDFIISLRSFQGGIEYSNYIGLCSPAYIVLRKKNTLGVGVFFKYYFKTEMFIRHLNRNIEGIRDGKMVSYKQFSEILLPTPKTEEQQKIASCLSSLDDLIAAYSQKLDALKVHKKGLMQGLFPMNNEQ